MKSLISVQISLSANAVSRDQVTIISRYNYMWRLFYCSVPPPNAPKSIEFNFQPPKQQSYEVKSFHLLENIKLKKMTKLIFPGTRSY